MGSIKEPTGDVILKEALGCGEEAAPGNPTVLSCGGIYIPRRPEEQKIIYQIITTSDRNEPVKIMTGMRPRNVLHEVLLKESMN